MVYCLGIGRLGQLGLGDILSVEEPTIIPNLKDIVSIECGYYHSLCLDKNGNVYFANILGRFEYTQAKACVYLTILKMFIVLVITNVDS